MVCIPHLLLIYYYVFSKLYAQFLHRNKPYTQVMDCDFPNGKINYFLGGELNASVNCVDRHAREKPNHTALIWERDDGTNEFYTFRCALGTFPLLSSPVVRTPRLVCVHFARVRVQGAAGAREPDGERADGPRRAARAHGGHLPAQQSDRRRHDARLLAHRRRPLGSSPPSTRRAHSFPFPVSLCFAFAALN